MVGVSGRIHNSIFAVCKTEEARSFNPPVAKSSAHILIQRFSDALSIC